MGFLLMPLKEKWPIYSDLFLAIFKQGSFKNSLQMEENSFTVLSILKTAYNPHVVYRLFRDTSFTIQIIREFESLMESLQSCCIRETDKAKTNKIIIIL